MSRVKHAVASHKKKKKVLELARGARGERSRRIRRAKDTLIKGLAYAYRDRRRKKREFRSLWISRINAAVREHGLRYGEFISALKQRGVLLSRDMLAHCAIEEPKVFGELVRIAKEKRG